MKAIFLTLSLFLAVQENFAAPSQYNEETYRKIASTILNKIEILSKEVQEIIGQTNAVQSKLNELSDKGSQIVNENSLVAEFKETFEKNAGNGVCQKVFDEKLYWLGVNLQHSIIEGVETNLKAVQFNMLFVKAGLSEINNELGNNLEEVLKTCQEDGNNCKITGEFTAKINENVEVVKQLKIEIPLLIENCVKFMKDNEVDKLAKKLLIKPVNNCLASNKN